MRKSENDALNLFARALKIKNNTRSSTQSTWCFNQPILLFIRLVLLYYTFNCSLEVDANRKRNENYKIRIERAFDWKMRF